MRYWPFNTWLGRHKACGLRSYCPLIVPDGDKSYVLFLLSLWNLQTWKGREKSKGYFTGETWWPGCFGFHVLWRILSGSKSAMDSVTFLKLRTVWFSLLPYRWAGSGPRSTVRLNRWVTQNHRKLMEPEDEAGDPEANLLCYFSIHSFTKLPSKSFLLLVLDWLCVRCGGCKVFEDLFLLSWSSLSVWRSRHAHSLL